VKLSLSRFSILTLVWMSGSLGAQELSPTVPPPATPAAAPALPAIERIADEAQRKLFEAADRAAGPGNATSNQPLNFPGAPQVSTTGKKTTFSGPKLDDPAAWTKDSSHKLAVMEIKFGGTRETVMFELYPQDAPQTVSNFLDNVETDAYKGLAFHRAVEGFIVQTGDPLTSDEGARDRWGTGGEGKTVPAEIKRPHRKGAIAMGRKSDKVNPSKRSNGYQFYFALGHYGSLDGKYTVFGQVAKCWSAFQGCPWTATTAPSPASRSTASRSPTTKALSMCRKPPAAMTTSLGTPNLPPRRDLWAACSAASGDLLSAPR
jgi:cyclophilin family peptidyl-prolyl cis-trans isomerase